MRHGSWALAGSSVWALGVLALQACNSSSSSPGADASTDASTDAAADVASDAPSEASDAGKDGTTPGDAGDAGDGATADGATADGGDAGATATFLAHFDLAKSEQPEGLWELGDAGTPVVGFAPLAQLATVQPDGGFMTFGDLVDGGAAMNTDTLGITTDTSGNVYVGVGSFTPDAGPVPAPGVYRFPPDGGAGTLFSSAPGMNFANGLDFVGSDLFVADSGGSIFRIDSSGAATVWSSDPLLAPSQPACDGGVPFAIGANGIVHDANNFYVTNTNFGRIVKIPMSADGGAGTASTIVDDCSLVGADGIALDPTSHTLLVALNVQDKIVRVTMSGQMSVVTAGPPLDSPASLFLEGHGATHRLLFTNAAFFSGDAGRPGLLAVPVP